MAKCIDCRFSSRGGQYCGKGLGYVPDCSGYTLGERAKSHKTTPIVHPFLYDPGDPALATFMDWLESRLYNRGLRVDTAPIYTGSVVKEVQDLAADPNANTVSLDGTLPVRLTNIQDTPCSEPCVLNRYVMSHRVHRSHYRSKL